MTKKDTKCEYCKFIDIEGYGFTILYCVHDYTDPL